MQSDIYFGPATVSFYNIQWEEVQAYFTTSGAWTCWNGYPHEANGPVPLQVGPTVNSYGSQIEGYDTAYSGNGCSGVNQIQTSSEYVYIPVDYGTGAVWYLVQNVNQSASETSTGGLSEVKTQASASTTVNSPKSCYTGTSC